MPRRLEKIEMRGYFITGTDTDVGKTYVTALIARDLKSLGYRVGVYKPVASGCRRVEGELVADDAVAVWEAAGRPATLDRVCPQRFEAPLAPYLAAETEKKTIDRQLVVDGLDFWRERSDVVLVEGAGGLLAPFTKEERIVDFARTVGYPLIVVARNALGTINHTLLTLHAAQTIAEDLPIAGVILNDPQEPRENDPSRATNRTEIERLGGVPVLGETRFGGGWKEPIDWRKEFETRGQ